MAQYAVETTNQELGLKKKLGNILKIGLKVNSTVWIVGAELGSNPIEKGMSGTYE